MMKPTYRLINAIRTLQTWCYLYNCTLRGVIVYPFDVMRSKVTPYPLFLSLTPTNTLSSRVTQVTDTLLTTGLY